MLLLWVEWRGGKGKSLNPFIPLLHWKVREKKKPQRLFSSPSALDKSGKEGGNI